MSRTKTRGNCLVLPHTGYALVPVPSRPSPPFPVLPLPPSLPFPSLSYLPPPLPLKTVVRGSSPGKFWYSTLLWVSFSTFWHAKGGLQMCVFLGRAIFFGSQSRGGGHRPSPPRVSATTEVAYPANGFSLNMEQMFNSSTYKSYKCVWTC